MEQVGRCNICDEIRSRLMVVRLVLNRKSQSTRESSGSLAWLPEGENLHPLLVL